MPDGRHNGVAPGGRTRPQQRAHIAGIAQAVQHEEQGTVRGSSGGNVVSGIAITATTPCGVSVSASIRITGHIDRDDARHGRQMRATRARRSRSASPSISGQRKTSRIGAPQVSASHDETHALNEKRPLLAPAFPAVQGANIATIVGYERS